MKRPAPVAAELALGVIEGFLAWCQKNRAPRTYRWYKDHLESFANALPDPRSMRVDELKPFHVQHWLDAHPTWGPTFRRGAVTAVQRAFLWAEKSGHIVTGLDDPRPAPADQW